jgi:ACS family hexuronate transporter-like MFS transporter
MPTTASSDQASSSHQLFPRSPAWIWALSFALFMATFLNYAHRVVLTQNSVALKAHFATDDAGYGRAEQWFGYGFAAGGLLFGVLADLISIRWLFPILVLAWSVATFGSARAESFDRFVAWRFVLGLCEAGHWPCSLRMTQRSYPPDRRTLGNGILQAGAAGGQIAVPLLLLSVSVTGQGWVRAFDLAAILGLPWIAFWLVLVRESDVRRPVLRTENPGDLRTTGENVREIHELPWYRIFLLPRWWLLLLVVVCINVPWHALRVWMPDTLQTHFGYTKPFVDQFTAWYYASTFIGSLFTGWAVAVLCRRGVRVHRARLWLFGLCATMVGLLSPAMYLLGPGSGLLGVLLVAAFGSLGLSPIYYSLNQEISGRAQGRVGGSLSFILWCVLALMQSSIGELVKRQPAIRPTIFATVALLPLFALVALARLWTSTDPHPRGGNAGDPSA